MKIEERSGQITTRSSKILPLFWNEKLDRDLLSSARLVTDASQHLFLLNLNNNKKNLDE